MRKKRLQKKIEQLFDKKWFLSIYSPFWGAVFGIVSTLISYKLIEKPQLLQVPSDFGMVTQTINKDKPWYHRKDSNEITINKEGLYHLKTHDFKEAIAKFQRGIDINPHLAYFHNNIGVALYELHGVEVEKAKAELIWAIDLDPRNPIPYENLALIHSTHVTSKRARECWIEALDCEKRMAWKIWLNYRLAEPD